MATNPNSLEWKIEEAAIKWLANASGHAAVATDLTGRHYVQAKTDANGNENLVALPEVIFQAVPVRQIHPNVAVFEMELICTMRCQADDTTDAVFQARSKEMEDIFTGYYMAENLTSASLQLKVDGEMGSEPGHKEINERHWDFIVKIRLAAQSTAPHP